MYEQERDQIASIRERFGHLADSIRIDQKETRLKELDAMLGSPMLERSSRKAIEPITEVIIVRTNRTSITLFGTSPLFMYLNL